MAMKPASRMAMAIGRLLLAIAPMSTAVSTVLPGTASAASFPERPVRLIVPFAPGGAADVVARRLAAAVGSRLGQPLVIENRAGAGTIIGSELTANAPPDGYTVLLITPSHTANPALHKKLPYDTLKSFAPVALICDAAGLFLVHPSVPAKTMAEFIAHAKSHPGEIAYATPGAGTFPHLTTEMLEHRTGIRMVHVPYPGAAPAMIDLIGGRVSAKVDTYVTSQQSIAAGTTRLLAVTSKTRIPQYPNIPTIAEVGYPGFETTYWIGIAAPAGVPPDIRSKLEEAFIAAVKEKDIGERLATDGMRVIGGTGADMDTLIRNELPQWREVVRDAGITPE